MGWKDWLAVVLVFLVFLVLGGPIRRRGQREAIRHFGRNGPPSRCVLTGINIGGFIGGYVARAIELIAKRWADRKRKNSN